MKKERRENLFIEITITIDVIHWSVGNENKSTRNAEQRERDRGNKKSMKMSSDFANFIFHMPFTDERILRRNLKLFNYLTARTHHIERENMQRTRKNVNARIDKRKKILFSIEELNCFIGNRISWKLQTFELFHSGQRTCIYSFLFVHFSMFAWLNEMLKFRRCHAQRPPYDNNNQLVHRTEHNDEIHDSERT